MKVLWVSNAPFVGSGYGVQAALFTRLIKQAGHEVVVFAPFGHHGPTLNLGGVPILPASLDNWGNDLLEGHIEHFQPDVTVLLADIWVYRPENVRFVTAWAPVDHDPIPPHVAGPLHVARQAWAMSRFAEREMKRVGLTPDYVPHGVDTAVYRPIDREKARETCGLDPKPFVAVMVSANRGYPSRKSLDRVLKAWGVFVKQHPDSLLYLHTLPSDTTEGIDLVECARFYGVPDDTIRFPDTYRFLRNDYSPERMNALYNAADVLLAPSMGEGFGVPVIEAQAAGCPVVVSDFTAQRELGEVGYRIPVDEDDKLYTLQRSEQAIIRPSEIVKSLEWAVEHRGDADLRAKARSFALAYDAQHVFDTYMLPALTRQIERERQTEQVRRLRTAARIGMRTIVQTSLQMEATP